MRATLGLFFWITSIFVWIPSSWADVHGPLAQDPNRHLEIGPIASLTSQWHPAPKSITLPFEAPLHFRVRVPGDVDVSWRGATEISNDGSWSVAECEVSHLAGHLVTVTATDPKSLVGEKYFEESIRVAVSLFPVESLRISNIDVWTDPIEIHPEDVNASTYTYFRGHSIAELQRLGRGLYQTSVDRLVHFSVQVDPPEFGALIEWWSSDGIAHLGSSFTTGFYAVGRNTVAVGPEARRQEVVVETYKVESIAFEPGPQIPEGDDVTFTAVTDPPGFEHAITWLASTTFGSTTPILGKGAAFRVRFDDTFGENGFRWLGVKADNRVLGQDSNGVAVSSCSPDTGGRGTILDIHGGGFGSDPDDLCLVLGPQGQIAARAFAANGTTIQAEVGAVPSGAVPGNWLVVRGNGSRAAIPDSSEIAGIPDAWAFEGSGGPAAEDVCVDLFTPIETLGLGPASISTFGFLPCGNCQPSCVQTEGQLRVSLPADACPNPPPNGYPAFTGLTIDVHFNVRCAPGCQQIHFDCFAPTLDIQVPLTSAQVAADLANKIGACFVNNGIQGISILAFGSDIEVTMPGCEIFQGGGSIFIDPNPNC